MAVKDIIFTVVTEVAAEQDRRIAPPDEAMVFARSGLDSLCFAIIVARLEDRLGVDPFTTSDDIAFPETLGAFVSLYERAAA